MATRTRKTTFAVLDKDLTTIENLYRLDDVPQDHNQLAMRYGARFVWLPTGGKVGQQVTVSNSGEAHVVRAKRSRSHG